MPDQLAGPLVPLILLAAYLCVSGISLFVHNLVSGTYRDAETDKRGASLLLPMGLRMFFMWSLQPIWMLVRWSGLPANAITTMSTLLAIGAGVAVAGGDLATGGWLYLAAGMGDVLDGRIARHSGTAGPRGAAIDSVLDRYADAAVLAGLAWYFRESWAMVLALVALVGSLLVSYVRARGEGLGVDVKVGVMQRPERVVLIGSSLALAPVLELATGGRLAANTALIVVLGIVAALTQITAARRLAHVVRAFTKERDDEGGFSRLGPATISAFAATAADFGLMSFLVSEGLVSASLATALGCLLGGVINFTLNRWWTFGSTARPTLQALRYTIVSVSSALLNSGGVALALLLPIPDYRIGWVVVRGVVFLFWNFPLQRDYVYGRTSEDKPAVDEEEPEPSLAGRSTAQ